MKYDENMDVAIIPLCDYLNTLEGIETTDSCEGHGKKPPSVTFNCNNLETLNFLASIEEIWMHPILDEVAPGNEELPVKRYYRYAKKAFPEMNLKWFVKLTFDGPPPELYDTYSYSRFSLTASKTCDGYKEDILRIIEYYQNRKKLMETDECHQIFAEYI